MPSIFRLAAAAGLLALAACDQSATGANGVLTGTWHYRAVNLEQPGPAADDKPCDEEYVLDITHHEGAGTISGLTRPASHRLTCYSPTEGVQVLQFTNPVQVGGEVQDGRIHFGATNHSFGEVHPDRIEGYVEGYYSLPGAENVTLVDTIGTFVMERLQ